MPLPLTRRQFLVLGGGTLGTLTLAACGSTTTRATGPDSTTRPTIGPADTAVAELEAKRASTSANVVRAALTAMPVTVDLAGRAVSTWAYSDQLGSPLLRAKAGEILEVPLTNNLPEATTIHWHGLALRNDMDGVGDLTQMKVGPGEQYTYRFALPDPGTYWFHPHIGLQLDRGLYAPLIIDDPNEPGNYDAEYVLVLDDWLDGFGMVPDDVMQSLKSMGSMSGTGGGDSGGSGLGAGGGMEGMEMGAGSARPVAYPMQTQEPAPGATVPAGAAMGQFKSEALGGDAGDVAYPLHLINGKPPADRPTFAAPPAGRVRLRIINAGSDTAYRLAVGGHRLTVTHSDGFPIEPIEVDTLILGMGERYDVVVNARSGSWPIVAVAEGKNAAAVAVLRTTDAPVSAAPAADASPTELTGKMLDYRDLRPAGSVRYEGEPDQTVPVDLTGNMMNYEWGINGQAFPKAPPIQVEQGKRVRFTFNNKTAMFHPIHLHGHTFAMAAPNGGARKDTVNVLPNESLSVDFLTDNPGQWMMHCHNTYHLESGMATSVSYVR
ncbi:MAG: multicopper oxidase family protein [Actinobacteria bacterium]|nr:multicopper oxidase family protein [Actinomycetota bacterium]